MHACVQLAHFLAQKTTALRSSIPPSTAQCPPSRLIFALIRTQPCRYGSYLHPLFGDTANHTAPVRSRIPLSVRERITARRIVSSLGFHSAIFRPHPLFRVCIRTLAVVKPSKFATLRRLSARKHALSAHPPATCLPATSYLLRTKIVHLRYPFRSHRYLGGQTSVRCIRASRSFGKNLSLRSSSCLLAALKARFTATLVQHPFGYSVAFAQLRTRSVESKLSGVFVGQGMPACVTLGA